MRCKKSGGLKPNENEDNNNVVARSRNVGDVIPVYRSYCGDVKRDVNVAGSNKI